MNKKWFWFLIVLGAVVFVGGPLFVQYTQWLPGSNGNGDWLGFWGSYLGIIPSGLIAWLVATKQINSSKENEKKNYMEKLYLEDLRKIKQYVIEWGFSGSFGYPYDIKAERPKQIHESDMHRIRKVLNIKQTKNYFDLIKHPIFDMKKIVEGLPNDKKILFKEYIDKLDFEINKFSWESNTYLKTKKHFDLEGELDTTNMLDSKLVYEEIDSISQNYMHFVNELNKELSVYYRVD